MWVTTGFNTLVKLNPFGSVLQTVPVGASPRRPVFDGTNIWVPNNGSDSVTVVRAATGAVLATLTGNGLARPVTASFDGERVLVTNEEGQAVSLWKASDLSPIGNFPTGLNVVQACSDGLNFFLTMYSANGASDYVGRY